MDVSKPRNLRHFYMISNKLLFPGLFMLTECADRGQKPLPREFSFKKAIFSCPRIILGTNASGIC